MRLEAARNVGIVLGAIAAFGNNRRVRQLHLLRDGDSTGFCNVRDNNGNFGVEFATLDGCSDRLQV
jgi:hypothetical protein